MSNNPQVSVLMPVYNAADYLYEAVESILNQSFIEIEFIIIDDGSTDNSLEILRSFEASDNRIKLISRENRGIVATRNELLDLATAEYFAIMDSDDISFPKRLEDQYSFLTRYPDHVIVGCRDMLLDPEGLPIKVINDFSNHEDVDNANLNFDDFQTLNAYMAETQEVRKVGGYRADVLYAEDRDLFLRMAEVGRVKVLPEILYGYRQHYTNTCVLKHKEIAENVLKVVQDAHDRRNRKFTATTQAVESSAIDKVQQYKIWAWWALKAKHINTARKYGRKVVLRRPFNWTSWHLLLCTLRGY